MLDKECQWEAQDLWRKFERALKYGEQCDRFVDAEKCWRFFEGDQWRSENGSKDLPFYNIIRPVVNYKKARIAMNNKNITFTTTDDDPKGIIEALNDQVRVAWEFGKMDSACWEIAEQGLVEGAGYLYFHDGPFFAQENKEVTRCNRRKKFAQILPGTQVFLGNEEEGDLQEQPYIIIEERLAVRKVRMDAKKNGVEKNLIDQILSDERSDAHVTTGEKTEQQGEEMVTCILYLERTEEGIAFCRCTKDVIFQPMQVIKGLEYYPIVPYVVAKQKGKARGIGEVKPMIPNQIEINRTLVRRTEGIRQAAYPIKVYNKDMIDDASGLEVAGAVIEMHDTQGLASIQQAIGYIQPTSIGHDAVNFENELISMTKELAGAGDAALGNINPEQASGAAITAVQDQADIPMNRELSAFSQMIEDIAILWYHMILAYNPLGYEGKKGRMSAEEMKKLCAEVRVEISSALPDTVNSRVNTLYQLLGDQLITFEEFLELVGNESNLPIEKLKKLREEAQAAAQQQELIQAEAMADQIQEEQEMAALESGAAGSGDFFGMMEGI